MIIVILFCQDGANPPRSVTTTLTINLINVLDPAPIFSQSIYEESIIEDTYTNVSCKHAHHRISLTVALNLLQQLVATIQAIDPQNPSGAIIRYEQVPPGES